MLSINQTEECLPPINSIVAFWLRNGIRPSVTRVYGYWVIQFTKYCASRGIPAIRSLVFYEVRRFAAWYSRERGVSPSHVQGIAQRSLRAWSFALVAGGIVVPTWLADSPPTRIPRSLAGYVAFRRQHSTACESSIHREVDDLIRWLVFLKKRGRTIGRIRLLDVDAYMVQLRPRYAVASIARAISTIRIFCRFLHTTGRLANDLACSIQCPPARHSQLPRALPWVEVQKILRAVDRRTRTGVRDYAFMLLMSLYGLGAAEVIGLQLDDIQWRKLVLVVRRPKTGVEIRLPLLPAAARALTAYLKRGRPLDASTRSVFVSRHLPYASFTSSAVRHAIRSYATRAGLVGRRLGSHVFRHSHASRQVDQHAPPQVLSSILGHRDPESTSVYARVAVERLRSVALPVPR